MRAPSRLYAAPTGAGGFPVNLWCLCGRLRGCTPLLQGPCATLGAVWRGWGAWVSLRPSSRAEPAPTGGRGVAECGGGGVAGVGVRGCLCGCHRGQSPLPQGLVALLNAVGAVWRGLGFAVVFVAVIAGRARSHRGRVVAGLSVGVACSREGVGTGARVPGHTAGSARRSSASTSTPRGSVP